ncbi:hypothetical protein INR49_004783 [Caranx melampygus]|nr:hypothetical protein INR49_004783 [Caranx melampygus]
MMRRKSRLQVLSAMSRELHVKPAGVCVRQCRREPPLASRDAEADWDLPESLFCSGHITHILTFQSTSTCPSKNGSSSSTPDVSPPEKHTDSPARHPADSPTHHTFHLSSIIPNRIFVGGIANSANEDDLRQLFSQYGAVKQVKIVLDRLGLPKGYGFVTFETEEDVLKILHNGSDICFQDKRLSIGQAVRKRHGQIRSFHVAGPAPAVPPTCGGTLHLTTPTGFPYSYHNGVAYFQSPSMTPPPAHYWPVMCDVQPSPPGPLPQSQSAYQQPAYHHNQFVPNQYQWPAAQLLMPSSPGVYPQHLYQPFNGGCVPPPLPVMEDTTPEFPEPPVQQVYPVYPQRADLMAPSDPQHDPRKNLVFQRSRGHLKPRYRRYVHHRNCFYQPEVTEAPNVSEPLM